MLNLKSFLAIDFGAGTLKLAEFEVNEAGGLRLKQFSIKTHGPEGAQPAKREALNLKALQEILTERGIKAKEVNVCAPGLDVFSKFVKLPPVDSSKVTQMIQYEAQQNVPFPLEEVVWDYQILGATPGGELEVLLVAIKADVVEGLFRITESSGLHLQLCDVSPAALCNAFRYNYGDLQDCTMLLDIGAKTSNLLFFEKGKVFSRSINIGANSITQDFASEAKLRFEAAEKIKIDEGFVSLGGAYAEPESQHQAAISKIARQFMTRLHIQVNQTLQFYRGQQGGSAPQRLFLAGGASLMPYTAQFFAEKLNVPVEYFNPFRNIQIDPTVNLEELARVAHSLGEVVGLGLRNLAHCPVELNLMPESTLRWQSFNQKKPYLIATVFSLVAMAFAVGFLFSKLADVKKDQITRLDGEITPLQQREQRFKRADRELKTSQANLDQVVGWVQDRYCWADILAELRRVLISAEADTKKQLGTDTGIWIERITSMRTAYAGLPGQGNYSPIGPDSTVPQDLLEARRRYLSGASANTPEVDRPVTMPGEYEAPPTPGSEMAGQPTAPTNAPIVMVCRGVSLSQIKSSANSDIAFAVQNQLQASPMFDPQGTRLGPQITPDEASGTFTFTVTLALKRPLKL